MVESWKPHRSTTTFAKPEMTIYDVIIWVPDGNCKKMTPENFGIGAFYNVTKTQDNPIKTVAGDSFLSPKAPKNTSFSGVTKPPEVAQPLYSRGHN